MSMLDLLQKQEAEEAGQVRGVAVGIVTNNKDPDGLGRVKVHFPWRENPDDSYWARISVLMAGKQRGSFFLPEVGDEVLVAFEREDIRHPYIIGALWNGIDTPPETNSDGKNNIRKIRSAAGMKSFSTTTVSQKRKRLKFTPMAVIDWSWMIRSDRRRSS
jgi:uncharacterized protein involved in type VI secretion and phage assembly